ncbi:MAG: hypothetical protein GYA24_17305 [Candidatus Lokiarchaeota archaeon]|nr:hypothetical protein [Candidatus Lokiarchaeota archaeon]
MAKKEIKPSAGNPGAAKGKSADAPKANVASSPASAKPGDAKGKSADAPKAKSKK